MFKEKFVLFSRRAWAWALGVPGAVLFLLSLATPDTVAVVMAPFVELADAAGWAIAAEHQHRALRVILALSAIVGTISGLRSRMAPDGAAIAFIPPSARRYTG